MYGGTQKIKTHVFSVFILCLGEKERKNWSGDRSREMDHVPIFIWMTNKVLEIRGNIDN